MVAALVKVMEGEVSGPVAGAAASGSGDVCRGRADGLLFEVCCDGRP